MTFEGYHYRTSSRFGSRVRLTVENGQVIVTGPRVGVGVYRFWRYTQIVLQFAVPLVLLAGLVLGDWRLVIAALGVMIVHFSFGALGVAVFWEMANLAAVAVGRDASESFPLSAVQRVRVGKGWARNGMWLVIAPYIAGIDSLSIGRCVSFEAPDAAVGTQTAVYSFYMWNPADAQALAAQLSAEQEK